MESTYKIQSPSKKRKKEEIKDFEDDTEFVGYDNEWKSTWKFQSESKKRRKDKEDVNSGAENGDNELKSPDKIETKNNKTNRTLLKLARDQVNSNKLYYKKEFRALNFEKIAAEMGTTPESCKERLKQLIERTSKIKCLHQVLQETIVEYFSKIIKTPKQTRKQTAFNHFITKNSKEIDSLMKSEGGKKFKAAADMWNKLTDGEKMAYSSKVFGKPPFDIFVESKQKHESSVDMKDLRKEWKNLELKKKFKFIKKSAHLMMKIEEGKESEKPIDRKCIKGPSKDEIILYLDYLGMPKKPPQIVQMFYFKESGVAKNEYVKNILQEAMRRFSSLDNNKKCLWQTKYEKVVREFDKTLKMWRTDQDPVTVYIINLYREFNKDKANKTKPQDQKKVKPINEYNSVEMSIGRIKFKGEPTIPPLTDAQLYSKEMKKTTGKAVLVTEARKKITRLPPFEKASLKFKVDKMRTDYISQMKSFVGSLIEEQKRLFLGVKRINLIRLLKEDIFEKDYPDTEFPIYVKEKMKIASETQTSSKKKQKKCISDSNENLTIDDDDDDDDEESMWNGDETSMGDLSDMNHTLKLDLEDYPLSDEDLDLATPNQSSQNSSQNPLHSKTVKMDSDSDDENMNHKSIQAYMNSLLFKNDNKSIAKEEEGESSDEY